MRSLDEVANSTTVALEVLGRLAHGEGSSFEEFEAMANAPQYRATWEHARSPEPPLLAHARRALLNLSVVERASDDAFPALSASALSHLRQTWDDVVRFGLDCVLRLGLVLLDFAKGGNATQRARWTSAGVDLSIHNEAAATILRGSNHIAALPWDSSLHELLVEVVAAHGVAGQVVRGECPPQALARFCEWLAHNGERLADVHEIDQGAVVAVACKVMLIIDACDTEAVRGGLVDDDLYQQFRTICDRRQAAVDKRQFASEPIRQRFARLRRHSTRQGESESERTAAFADLAPYETWLSSRMEHAHLWYFEPATHALSPAAALRLLMLAIGCADAADSVDCDRTFHLTFRSLVETLGSADSVSVYRVRLVEALLRSVSLEDLRTGTPPRDLLTSIHLEIGGSAAIEVAINTTAEADALVTLLTIYQDRSSVAFHQILKLLCDAYDLRKDDFDRISAEANYLTTMNAARSDKERMLDFVRGPTIVEVGPGGGVVLDLLQSRFPDAAVFGLDASAAVIDELEKRRAQQQRHWNVIHGDAFHIKELFEPQTVQTVVCCSLLHEIYSYVEHEGRKFQIESVRAFLQSVWSVVAERGRLVIRDGVEPPSGERIVEFLHGDGPDFLRRFVNDFEGRRIQVEWIHDAAARMSTADAMEFLYCYTWGPASYPYEVREQYGVMQRDEYEQAILSWLPGAKAVQIPPDLKSYLQPGYVTGLASLVRLTDVAGTEVALPDSNAVWVFERSD